MTEVLGVIGGSGLYEMDGIEVVEQVHLETPYGLPSDGLVRAQLAGSSQQLLFLPRHGRGHALPPHAINYRANICALKLAGATQLLSVSATGSMRRAIAPGDLVVVDQFIDMTKRRRSTFFDAGVVAHVAFADPICGQLATALQRIADEVVAAVEADTRPRVHRGGTYLCIEGPQFSTRAESLMYRGFGVSLVGMTNMPEAKLAREACLPYATLALATDYDCWHASEEAVDVPAVIARLRTMTGYAQTIIKQLATQLPNAQDSAASHALDGAIITAEAARDRQSRARLNWLLGDPHRD